MGIYFIGAFGIFTVLAIFFVSEAPSWLLFRMGKNAGSRSHSNLKGRAAARISFGKGNRGHTQKRGQKKSGWRFFPTHMPSILIGGITSVFFSRSTGVHAVFDTAKNLKRQYSYELLDLFATLAWLSLTHWPLFSVWMLDKNRKTGDFLVGSLGIDPLGVLAWVFHEWSAIGVVAGLVLWF